VCGDLPVKTFRVLKEKEIKQYGDAPQSQPVVGVGEVGWDGRKKR